MPPVLPLPPADVLPPPQLIPDAIAAIASRTRTALSRCLLLLSETMQMPTAIMTGTSPDWLHSISAGPAEAAELEPVVEIVSVTGTVVVAEVKVTVAGLKLQLLFGGKLEHIVGESVAEPANPFCGANVILVDPDCPALAMLIDVGLAVIVKVCPTSITVTCDVDPV